MKISTKTGDKGTCGLMFGERISKASLRVNTYGSVDELCAALGLARALCKDAKLNEKILDVQNTLIKLMTELATSPKNHHLLAEKNIAVLSEGDLSKIEAQISEIEASGDTFKGWKMAGSNQLEANLNFARAICRKAERMLVELEEKEGKSGEVNLKYLNRLSDLIYLWSLRALKD